MLTILLLLAVEPLDDLSGRFVVDLFTPHEFRQADGRFAGQLFRYRLFEPDLGGGEGRLPLIVWLHGEGESGNDNIAHLRWLALIFKDESHRRNYPFFVLAVQKPVDVPWYRSNEIQGSPKDDALSVVASILDSVLQQYSIDPNRVYVSGVSSGGSASWELGIRHADKFAAIAPLSSTGADLASVNRLVAVPVRAFHSRFDAGWPPDSVRQTIAALDDAGGNAELIEIESNRHDSWTAAFQEHDLLKWMLSQKRGATSPDLFGRSLVYCRHIVATYGIVFLFLVGLHLTWRHEQRRRGSIQSS